MSFLVLMNGLPATLKTTISKQLSQLTGYPVISTNNYGSPLNKEGGVSTKKRTARYSKLFKDLDKSLKRNRVVFVDASFVEKSLREKAYRLARKNKISEVIMIRCICSNRNTLLKRFKHRQKYGHGEGRNFNIYREIQKIEEKPFKDKVFDKGNLLSIIVINTHNMSIKFKRGKSKDFLIILKVLSIIVKKLKNRHRFFD